MTFLTYIMLLLLLLLCCFSRVRLLVTPWTAAYQAPLSTGFSRQEYWSGLPLPPPHLHNESLRNFSCTLLFIFKHFWKKLICNEVKSEVIQSCPTFSDPMDCSLPGSSVHGFSRQEYWSGVPLPSPSFDIRLAKKFIYFFP